MSSMDRDLVREVARGRAADAEHRRLVRDVKEARRAERRAERETGRRWWRRAVAPVADPPLAVAPPARPEQVTEALSVLLEELGKRISENGTESEREALHAVADVIRWLAPGAAGAVVDWEGLEAARLRAFGLLHGAVLRGLDRDDHSWLLGRLRGTGAEHDDRVA